MSTRVPALPLEADPLIAEARQRARRRRLLAVAVVGAAAAAIGSTLGLRSSGGEVGVCATPPAGWKERTIPKTGMSEATVVLTNFRFGRMDDFYGLASPLRWPSGGVMVAVSNEGPDATPPFRGVLRVGGADFKGFEGLRFPASNVALRSQGRVLNAYVEAGSLTPSTIAAANRALAGVHTCSA
jgi:hypothetical protein